MYRFKKIYQNFIHKYQDEQTRTGNILLYLILPLVLVFLTETFASHNLFGGFLFLIRHPYAFFINAALIMVTLLLSFFFRRRMGVGLFIAFIWLALGVINGIVLIFRVTPFTGSDLLLLKDGKDIISKYVGPVQIILILLVTVILVIAAVYFFLITPKEAHFPSLLRSVPTIILISGCVGFFLLLGQRVGFLETAFHELSVSYQKNGFYYCFTASIVDTGIRKPSDYSQESIEELALTDDLLSEDNISHSRKPNVVIVQLETFFNVNRLKGVTFSEEPLTNFTNMLMTRPAGLFSVPVVGAGTINSEFEVLTGMNVDDFGIGEYPFKTIVKEQPVESIAYLLKENEYNTFAIHDNTGDFYERNQVYCNLGFDVFSSVEYMWPTDYTPMDWCKDNVLVSQVQLALDSTPNQDLVYVVSVQGHGSYPTEDLDYEKHITITESENTDPEYLNQLTYYVNQLYEMDQFIGNLIQMLENQKEPTILLMYGDHLPSLDLTDEDLKYGSIYQTEYFIWNNCNLKFFGYNREAYTVTSEILKALDITNGAINSYHQSSRKKMNIGQMTNQEYLEGLKQLEYDLLYGDKIYYNGENPYEPTQLRMGIYPVTIESAQQTKDNVLILHGQNFTRYSRIYQNESELTTLYIDPTTLVAADVTLSSGDILTVMQSSLSTSDPYIID